MSSERLQPDDVRHLFESIVEHVPVMIFVKDAVDLRFELFNKAGEVLLGYDRNDLYGKNDYDFFPKEQADFFTQKDREVLAGGKLVRVEEPIATKSGERWLITQKIPILDPEGNPKHLLGVSLDITERKQHEDALRQNAHLEEAVRQLLAMEGLATAGALAVELAGRMDAEIASQGARGLETVRGLVGTLRELGAQRTANPSRGEVDVRSSVNEWTATRLGRPALGDDLSEAVARASMTEEELTQVLDAVLALAHRLVGRSDAEVDVALREENGFAVVELTLPALELSARRCAELSRTQAEAALASIALARSDGAFLAMPARPGTRFHCRLCPAEQRS